MKLKIGPALWTCSSSRVALALLVFALGLAACSTPAAPTLVPTHAIPATSAPTPIPPTSVPPTATAASTATVAPTVTPPPPPALVAFVRREGGTLKSIYVMNADGSNARRVSNQAESEDPAWSPDGKQIAFTCSPEMQKQICVVGADGSGRATLTAGKANDEGPSWSPDGKKLAFTSDRDGNPEIYVMNADGSAPTRLTNNPGKDREPAWSPDGKRIVFISYRSLHGETALSPNIFVMNADGSNQVGLTQTTDGIYYGNPAWSPDGKRIAFESDRQGPALSAWIQIHVMNSDGSNITRLTNSEGQDRRPSWSADGKQIAFDSTRDLANKTARMINDQQQIYVIGADGSSEKKLTSATPEYSSQPAWLWGISALPISSIGATVLPTAAPAKPTQPAALPTKSAPAAATATRVPATTAPVSSAGKTSIVTKPQGQLFHVGDVVKLQDLPTLMVVPDQTIALESAKLQDKVLIAKFTIENMGKASFAPSSFDFLAKDGAGESLDEEVVDCPEPALDGEIAPGAKLNGTLCWDTAQLPVKIYYLRSVFQSDAIGWEIQN